MLTDHRWPLLTGNAGIRQTLGRMAEYIRAPSPTVTMIRRAYGFADLVGDQAVEEALYFVRGHLHYLEHPPSEQQLITPEALLHLISRAPDHRAIGDCVSYVVLLGALLWPRRLTLVVRSKREDRMYDHVYLKVQMMHGWMPVDPSGDAAIGWEETDGITAREEMTL